MLSKTTYRAKLHRLVVLDGDILRYIKLFNETANKITETLSDEELISDFFKGIKDRKILQDVMIDPKTGRCLEDLDTPL
jgi:hypothetical protein